MATVNKLYGKVSESLWRGKIDFLNHDIRVMLCTDQYTPNQDTHIYKTQVTDEITDANYTAGGYSLTNKTMDYDSAANKLKLDADDVSINGSIKAKYAVVYDDTHTDKPLLGYIDLDNTDGQASVASINSAFKVIWNPNGIFDISVGG